MFILKMFKFEIEFRDVYRLLILLFIGFMRFLF